MQKKLNKVARDTNAFLENYLRNQKKNKANKSNQIWIVSWRKKNKSKNFS